MKYALRDYQVRLTSETLEQIRAGVKRILIQLPTRGGKSGIIAAITEEFRSRFVWFFAHTAILIDQMSQEYTDHGINHGIIRPDAPQLNYRCQVISKDSLLSRHKSGRLATLSRPDVIIIDEAHLALADTYQQIIDLYPEAVIIGLTATPIRLDRKGLGRIFQVMLKGPSIQALQARKILCPVDTYAVDLFDETGVHTTGGDYNTAEVMAKVDKPFVLAEIVKHWEDRAKGKKTLTFCASIQHARDMAEQFNQAGYPSVAIDSKDGKEVIRQKLRDYYAGKYINLCSVNLFLMGLTVRDCECIIQARPTQSLMIYLQALGRGMMYLLGKVLINLDCVNNWTRHGLPEDDREWSLADPPKRKTKEVDKATLKRCPACLHPVKVQVKSCPHCGFVWSVTASRTPQEKDGKLVKIQKKKDLTMAIAERAKTLKEAVAIAQELGEQASQGWFVWTKILKKS